MKKLLLFLMIFAFGLALVGCDGEPGEDTPDDEITNPNDTKLEDGFTDLNGENQNGEVDAEGYYHVGDKKFKVVDTYKTYYTTEPTDAKFNYLINSWTYNSEHYTNMVDGLVENDKYGNLVGAVARGYKVVDNTDGTQTWTFQLKEGVKWVDNATGDVYGEVKADDFVAGIEYVLDPINGSGTATIVMGMLKGAKEYYEKLADDETADFSTVGVAKVNDYQVAYTLKEPTPYFLSSLTYSPFLPVNRAFLAEKGTDFGQTENDILVNGAFRITKHTASSSIIYEKNQNYYDRDHVYVNRVEKRFFPATATPADLRRWFEAGLIDGFVVNATDDEGYKKYVTGDAGTGTVREPANPYCNGVLLASEATYIGYFNFARENFEYSVSADSKNASQKAATAKALLNVNFRKGFLYGLNVMESLKWYNEKEPYQRLSRGYTITDLAVYNGKDYTEYVDEVFNQKQGTSGISLVGVNHGSDPIFDEAKAKTFFTTAKAELIANAGLTQADFPIQVDVIASMNAVRRGYEQKMYESLTRAGEGVIKLCYNVPQTTDQNTLWGSVIANYDFSLWSGWGPDYADPKTFLNTMAIGGDMVDMLGFTQKDAANTQLEKDVLGGYDALYRAAIAVTDVNKLDERYQKMAEAEYALIYEYAIIVPWMGLAGYSPQVSRVVPFQVGRAPYGLTSDKLKNLIVTDTPMTKELRAAVRAAYDAGKAE